jgi:hypothetical protein
MNELILKIRGSMGKDRAGKEIFDIKPIILGGSPMDPDNKIVLERKQHIQAVRYWNSFIQSQRGWPR